MVIEAAAAVTIGCDSANENSAGSESRPAVIRVYQPTEDRSPTPVRLDFQSVGRGSVRLTQSVNRFEVATISHAILFRADLGLAAGDSDQSGTCRACTGHISNAASAIAKESGSTTADVTAPGCTAADLCHASPGHSAV